MNCQEFRTKMMLTTDEVTNSELVAMVQHGNGCPDCRKAWNDTHRKKVKEMGLSRSQQIKRRVELQQELMRKMNEVKRDPELGAAALPEAEVTLLQAGLLDCEDIKALEGAGVRDGYDAETETIITMEMAKHLNACKSCRDLYATKYRGATAKDRIRMDHFQKRAEMMFEAITKRPLSVTEDKDNPNYVFVDYSGVKTHHFFAVNEFHLPLMVTHDGKVMVYLDREQATRDFKKRFGDTPFGIVGMGDEKWRWFQNKVPHVIVPKEET
jgi:hypothetical protein